MPEGLDHDGRDRCPWAKGPWLVPYHDDEWGVAVHDDRRHFELLVLEGAQAGLSWLTVLRRREAYRRVFCDFDPQVVARFEGPQVTALLDGSGIIAHRGKVESAITNAAAFLAVQQEAGSFDAFVWELVGGVQVVNHWRGPSEVPARTERSEMLSAELRRRGFRFVGPTICYAYLQAAGLVVDHLTSCFRHPEASGRHAG